MNNDFHNTHNLFELFEGLTVKDFDVDVPADDVSSKPAANGSSGTNGVASQQNGTPAEIATKN